MLRPAERRPHPVDDDADRRLRGHLRELGEAAHQPGQADRVGGADHQHLVGTREGHQRGLVADRPPADVGSRVRLMVHENWRFRPWYRELARWLREGRAGTVRQVRMTWFNAGLLPDAEGRLPIFAKQPYMARVPRLIVGDVLMRRLTDLDLSSLPAAGKLAGVQAFVAGGEGSYRIFFPQEYGHSVVEAVRDVQEGLA